MMPYSWLDRRDLSMDFGTIWRFRKVTDLNRTAPVQFPLTPNFVRRTPINVKLML